MGRARAGLISVLIVDDHRTFAEALALAVSLEKGLTVDVARTGEAALASLERQHPNVIFIDVEMPGMDGMEAIRRLKGVDPSMAVIVLSGHDDDLLRGRALEAGASGYVSKDTALEELSDLARRAHRGEPLMEPNEVVRLLKVLRKRRHQEATERQRANRLTPRQTQILQLMADGLSSREIAKHLDMSPFTLRTHVQSTLTRLGVHTKLEAVTLAIRHRKITVRT